MKTNKVTLADDLFGMPKTKKGIGSNAKGKTNERRLAKLLTEWVGKEFNRVPQSGGLRWKNASKVIGDLVCEDDSFPFTIETKHYKEVCIEPILRKNSIIFTFWKQAYADAERVKKIPIMFIRSNGMKATEYYVVVSEDIGKKLNLVQCFEADNGVHKLVGIMYSEFTKITYNHLLKLLKLTK